MAAYEALRKRVLAGSMAADSRGLVVILREGVAAWIARGAPTSTENKTPVTSRAEAPRAAAPAIADEIKAGIVRVLAGMALGMRCEVST